MSKKSVLPCSCLIRFACKVVGLAIGMFLSIGAFAQTEPRFFMEVDTAYSGISVGQEVELRYSCTAPFDSVVPPEFGKEIEVVSGPKPRRVMSAVWGNGRKKQGSEIGFSFQIRFLREGIVSLPVASVKIGGKAYDTPPFNVWVKPALWDIQEVECLLSAFTPHLWEDGTFRITLTCNRRPDQWSPLLTVNGRKYEPSGRSSGFSSAKGTIGGKPGTATGKERYEFHYNVPSGDGKTCTCSVEELSFGGVPYPMESREIEMTGGKQGTATGNKKRVIVAVITGVVLIFGGMWLRFRREANEETAVFVLRYKRLNLGTEWALTHYGFPLFLGSIPFFIWLFNLYGYLVDGRREAFFPWFWCGVLPLVLAFVFWHNQRLKLHFQAVPTSLSPETLREVMEEIARENGWTVDHAGEDCIVAHTHRRWWSATWGEQIFLVFDRGQVWVNSVNDLNKRSVACPFGYTKKNIRIVQEAIAERERAVAAITE